MMFPKKIIAGTKLSLCLLLGQLSLFTDTANAGPEGGNIVGGSGAIHHTGNTTNINQATDLMAIDWQSYNVSADERVNYIQPDSSSISLNRILSNQGSEIRGRIDATGQVILVNPNGIVFGKNSVINVGGILASGLDINPDDFMNHDFAFSALEGTKGQVVNSGTITAATGGSVSLVGRQVANDGLIVANLGAVNLAAGKEAVVTFDNSGLMGVRVTKEILQEELGLDASVMNSGEISVGGGRILLSGSVSEDIFTHALNIDKQATSVVVNEDGSFTLGAGADVLNTGKLSASSDSESPAGLVVMVGQNVTSSGEIDVNGSSGAVELHSVDETLLTQGAVISAASNMDSVGGTIKIFGNKVGLFDHSIIDVSGFSGGGNVYIGGDYRGGNRFVRNAHFTYVGPGVSILANADSQGDGGSIILWADKVNRYFGNIEAKGGESLGNGGFAEVSGKETLVFNGTSILSSRHGNTGKLLLDPHSIDITSSGSDLPADADPYLYAFSEDSGSIVSINAISIENLLASNDVELQATSDIRVNQAIDGSSANNSLTLTAGDDLQVNQAVTLGGGSLVLSAGSSACGGGCSGAGLLAGSAFDGRILDLNANLTTDGGSITLNSSDRGGYEGETRISNGITISTGLSGGNISLSDSVISSTHSELRLEAGTGNVSFGGDVGSFSYYLSGLNIQSAGKVSVNSVWTGSSGIWINASDALNLGGGLYSDAVSTAGAINITGDSINLGTDLSFDAYSSTQNSITIGSLLNANGYNVAIYGGAINIAGIVTSGSQNQGGGNIIIDSTLGITNTGVLDSSGGAATAGNSGSNGGIINVSAVGQIDQQGAVSANGTDGLDDATGGGNDRVGGVGGNISITSSGGSLTLSSVSTNGGNGHALGTGNGDDANGGDAGYIILTATSPGETVEIGGDLLARGGRLWDNDMGRDNGAGGQISINGDVTLTSSILVDSTLNNATASSTQKDPIAGNITFSGAITGNTDGGESLVVKGANVSIGGTVGDTRLGAVSITAVGETDPGTDNLITQTGDVDLSGQSITATSLSVTAGASFSSLNIDTTGLSDSAGGMVSISAGTTATAGNITTTGGLRSTDGSGYAGGAIDIEGEQIEVGTLITNGGDAFGAGDNPGGSAGTITIDALASNSVRSITIGGAISSLGGTATGSGAEGASPTAQFTLQDAAGDGAVTFGDSFPLSDVNVAGSDSSANTLTAPNTLNTWTSTDTNSGEIVVTGTTVADDPDISFTAFENIVGGGQSDTFNIGDSFSDVTGGDGGDTFNITATGLSFSLSGGNDSDLLVGPNAPNNWTIGLSSDMTASALDGITFSEIENVTGNGQVDSFTVSNLSLIAGVISGAGGIDDITFASSAATVAVEPVADSELSAVSVYNIENIFAPGGSTLTTNNVHNEWTVTDFDGAGTVSNGIDDGTLLYDVTYDADGAVVDTTTVISFTGFSNLDGAAGNDVFTIDNAARLTGTIDGNRTATTGDVNTLQSNNISGTNVWNPTALTDGSVDYNGNSTNYVNIQNFVGSSVIDTLNGLNSMSIWEIAASGNTYALASDPDTRVSFSNMDVLQGGSGEDTFNISAAFIGDIRGGYLNDSFFIGASILSGSVYGENGGDTFTITNNNVTVDIVGGDAGVLTRADEVIGWTDPTPGAEDSESADNNLWQIDGPDSGTLKNEASLSDIITFSGIEVITGGDDEADIVEFAGGYSSGGFDGSVDGGSGDDIFYLGIDRSIDGGVSGGDGNDRFMFDGGVFTGVVDGGNGSDGFYVNASDVSTVNAVNGGNNEDSVFGPVGNSVWRLDADNSGVLNPDLADGGFQFTDTENITGGDGVDTFDFRFIGMFSGTVDAGDGDDIVDLSHVSSDSTVVLGQSIHGVSNAEVIKGDGSGTLTVSPSVAVDPNPQPTLVTWTIGDLDLDGDGNVATGLSDAVNDGTVEDDTNASIRFLDFAGLTGSSINDYFLIEDGAALTGTIDGRSLATGSDRNTLQNDNSSGTTTWILSSMFNGAVSYGAGPTNTPFRDIHILSGSAGTDVLYGTNVDSRWIVDAASAGTYALASDTANTLQFSEMDSLRGGSQSDTFDLRADIGSVDGGAGPDRFEINAALFSATLTGGEDPVTDSSVDRVIALQSSENFWQLNGAESGTVNNGSTLADPKIAFSQMEYLEGSADRADIYQLLNITSVGMSVLAGDGAGDDTLSFEFTDPAPAVNLSIAADATATLGFQGLETINGTGVSGSSLTAVNEGISTWLVGSTTNSLSMNGHITVFSGFTDLIGGNGSDDFTITGSIDSIDGGLGTNSLSSRSSDSEFNLGSDNDPYSGSLNDISTATATTYVEQFANIQSLTGNGASDLLTASSLNLNLTVDLAGNTGTLSLAGMETINANPLTNNTLIGQDASSTWTINTVNGDLRDNASDSIVATFSGFQNLIAGNSGDTFNINAALDSVTGGNGGDRFNIAGAVATINGGDGNDQFFLDAGSAVAQLDGQDGADDTMTGFTTESDWVINSIDTISTISTGGQTTSFLGMENLNGRDEVVDTYTLNSLASTAGLDIDAGGGSTEDTVDYSAISEPVTIDVSSASAFSGVANAERIEGNSNHTLLASLGANWRIYDFDGIGGNIAEGQNDGEVDGTRFVNFGSLRGGSGPDTFLFDGGILTGNIVGAGDNDQISRTATDTTWVISGADQGTFDDLGGRFSNIRTLQGNAGDDTFRFQAGSSWSGVIIGGDDAGVDTLQSQHATASNWEITGSGSGLVAWLNNGSDDGFSGIETLIGSDNSDVFNLNGGSIGTITGGAGPDDEIIALNNDLANTWNIIGTNAGNITNSDGSVTYVAAFTSIENLTGNSATDTFDIGFEAQISGLINGSSTGTGESDELNLADFGHEVVVNLGGEGVGGFNILNVEDIVVDGNLLNTLAGGNIARTWYVTGSDTVTIDGRTYSGFAYLTGGNLNDNFIFEDGGSLRGTISGGEGAGTDSVTGPNQPTEWYVDGDGSGKIVSLLDKGFSQIESIQGGGSQDTFNVDANISRIAGGNGNDNFNINTAFDGILDGEADNDTFVLGAEVRSEVIGGTGADVFNIGDYTSDFLLTGGTESGDDADGDTLTLEHSEAADWQIDGADDSVTVGSAVVRFSDIQVINGSRAADVFNIDSQFDGEVNGRDGSDEFYLAANITGGANGGVGDDDFYLDAAGLTMNIDGGDESDSITVNHGEEATWFIDNGVSRVESETPGTVSFSQLETIHGSTGIDHFELGASFNRVEGRSGSDVFNINMAGINASIDGGTELDELNVKNDSVNTWTINGGSDETLSDDSGGTILFSAMDYLSGGSRRDTFDITTVLNFVNGVDGNDGDDVFNVHAQVTTGIRGGNGDDSFNLFAEVNGELDGGNGSDVFSINQADEGYSIIGGTSDDTGADTLVIEYNDNSTWTFSGSGQTVSADTFGETTTFSYIERVEGGAGIDTVELGADFNGSIDGRGNSDVYRLSSPGLQTAITDTGTSGSDSLTVVHPEDTVWVINSSDGQLTDTLDGTIAFSGIEIASGGEGDDTFTIDSAMEQVNGGNGEDTFYIGADLTSGAYGGAGNDQFVVSLDGVKLDIYGGDDNDMLNGADVDGFWAITNTNTGELTDNNGGVVAFYELENLTGGSGDDTFTFSSTGGLDGGIDGGAHADGDSIDASLLGGNLDIYMAPNGSATFSFTNIENITVAEQPTGNYNTLFGDDSENVWIFTGRNAGRIEDIDGNLILDFDGFQDVIAGTGSDTIRLSNEDAGVDGAIFGGDGGPDFIDYSDIAQDYQAILGDTPGGVYGIEGAIGFMPGTVGENYRRTLLVENQGAARWTIGDYDGDTGVADGQNDGEYTFTPLGGTSTTLSFANFDTIIGGEGNDTFAFEGNATITGSIDGGLGYNIVDTDTEVADGTGLDRTFQLNGSLPEILNLQRIQEVISNAGSNNTLVAGDLGASHSWIIDGENRGVVNGISFDNFANLTGSDSIADSFVFSGNDNITGLINGGSGSGDSVNLVGLASGRDMVVELGSGVDSYLNILNIETLNANTANNNLLIAENRANTWNISGTGNGTIENTGNVLAESTTAFTGFNSLTGGNLADVFIFDGDDNITGLVDGGAGTDEVRLSGLTRDVTVALDTNVTSDLNVVRFETISANGSRNNTLRAGNDPNLGGVSNTWLIEAENSGRVNDTIAFSGFGNLVGSELNDTYEFVLTGGVTGYLDGGEQTGEDVVDMRALQSVSISLGNDASGMRNIERFVGNNINSVITADDSRNTWNLLSGVNDGTINGIVFTDFNYLVGGTSQDTFNINGGAITGNISGADGNDIVNLTLGVAAAGELHFVGGNNSDTLTVAGGGNGYSVAYSPDLAGESRLEYSDADGNAYTVSYATTENVQDNVTAGQFTVNGSAAADNIVLDTNSIKVGDYASVNYTNKNNLVLAGAANDAVLIDGIVTVPGQVTIRNSTVAANDGSLISAGNILFSATGSVGAPDQRLALDVTSVAVRSANGDIYLQNRGDTTLTELTSASVVNLVAAGQVTSTEALSSQGLLSITAQNGNIDLTNSANSFGGPLALEATGNGISLANSGSINLVSVASQTLNITSGGSIRDSGPLIIGGLASFEADADIVLDSQDNDFNTVSISEATDVTLVDANQLTLASFSGSGTLSTLSQGLLINGQVHAGNMQVDARGGSFSFANVIDVDNSATIQAHGIAANGTLDADNIALNDSDGGIELSGSLNTDGGEILLSSQGADVKLEGVIDSRGGDVAVEAAGEISMSSSAQTSAEDAIITYTASGNISLSNVNAGQGGSIVLTSGGGIAGTAGSGAITANRLEMSAHTGIEGTGQDSLFRTDINELFITNDAGEVKINNAGTVVIDRLRSNGDIYLRNDSGDIIFNNEPDNTYDRDQTDALLAGGVSNANFSGGLIDIYSSGSILAYGAAESTQPDIVGRVANLFAPVGDIGTGGRPLVIYARDQVFIKGFRSLEPFWAFGEKPPKVTDDSDFKVDLLDLINLGGEQLVEVEELEEVNPAIFTAVTNYFYDDVSIRLPNDQLYEYELEENE